ncbi:rhodanese-like domain-containing protein [Pelagicoccus mobilis]|uniref:Rhodanese-like domain-containing protein n=1 Tax=Pelagicoccus mobilis TaxID=415221 RepID=A0A934RWP9_9BACT|nr:rhodanese-like domain-containing protein [Pelagicoccus mobilis]MBK1878192.1 rhodanese-like domain-containing protein [Pelagicoccus mobilis]
MKETLGQSVLLVGLAAVLAFAGYLWRPDALPWDVRALEIELAAANELEEALWVDARVEEDFQQAHLGGALLLNEESWEAGFVGLLEVWFPDRPIVVYCSSQSCLRSHHVAKRLREELGVENVFSLKGGWEAMLETGKAKGGES